MSIFQLLGSTLGLGLTSGINLYATVLVIGIGIRLGVVVLHPELQQLHVLASPIVIAVAGLLFLVELLVDKIKWIDSIWDAVHTFIRPLGAALIGATALGAASPEAVVLALLCGGVALSGHSTKAGVRLLVNHSPEPFSNVAVSLFEDGIAVLGSYAAVQDPYLMLLIVVLFVIGFLWFAPRVFRLVRIELTAIVSVVKKTLANLKKLSLRLLRRSRQATGQNDLASLISDEMPVEYLYHLRDKFKLNGNVVAIKCAAGKGVRGLRHSIGYLNITPHEVIFTSRRHFRFRDLATVRSSIEHVHFKKHLLLDRLVIRANGKQQVLYFFKDATNRGEIISSALQNQSSHLNIKEFV